MPHADITCQEFDGFLLAYVSEELAWDLRASFEQHIEDCPACARYLVGYRETIRLGRQVCASSDDELPAGVPADLVTAVLRAIRTQS